MATNSIDECIPDFKGRAIFVYIKGKPVAQGHYIIDPLLQKQGDRIFLVGTTPSQSRLSNQPFGIAWDAVEAYVIADNIEEFTNASKPQSPSTE